MQPWGIPPAHVRQTCMQGRFRATDLGLVGEEGRGNLGALGDDGDGLGGRLGGEAPHVVQHRLEVLLARTEYTRVVMLVCNLCLPTKMSLGAAICWDTPPISEKCNKNNSDLVQIRNET